MAKSIKKMMEKQEIQKKKNPGKANREARKAERGATFVGFRPSIMSSKKQFSRAALKKQTRKELDY